MKVRKPWLAFLLSLLCPGLGQLYNGSPRWAFGGLAAGALLGLFAAIYLFGSLGLLIQAVLLSFAFDLFFGAHAYWQARERQAVQLQPYQRWWIYLGFALVAYGLPDGYGTLIPQRFRSFQIPSESMVPNLLVGDRLVADGWVYWKDDPKRGDVVVFDYPNDPSVKYVKRIIGMPGDVVELRTGELYVNSTLVRQRRMGEATVPSKGWNAVEFAERQGETEYRVYRSQPPMFLDYGPETVPEGSYFVLGDNRDRSNDSRLWGFVKRDAIIGRMAYIYFSWDAESGSIRRERIGLEIQ
jgi:signal peptidase I